MDFNLNIFKKHSILSDKFYLEGWKDTLKSGFSKIKQIAKKMRLLPKVPKNPFGFMVLHNLIMRSKPVKSSGIPLLGTSLQVIKKDNKYVLENVVFANKEVDSVLMEAISENRLKAIIDNFCKRSGAEARLVKSNSGLGNLLLMGQSPAAAIQLNDINLKQLKEIDDITKPVYVGNFKGKALIIFSPDIIPLERLNEKAVELMVAHEYGHVKTFHLVSDADYDEYFAKAGIVRGVNGLVGQIPMKDLQKIILVASAVYSNLKPEKLANDYSKIDFKDVVKYTFGLTIPNDWQSDPFAKLLNMKIPSDIMWIYNKLNKSLNPYPTSDEYKTLCKFSITLYKELLNPEIARPMIDSLKAALAEL